MLFKGVLLIQKSWKEVLLVQYVQALTCMFVPTLTDTRCRVWRGAITPGEEESCTFHCEEALIDARKEENRRGGIIRKTGTQLSNHIWSVM